MKLVERSGTDTEMHKSGLLGRDFVYQESIDVVHASDAVLYCDLS